MENVRVELLDKDGTTSLIKETFGEQTVTPEFADLIYQHTKGNPFIVQEVLQSLVDDGTVFRTERGWDRKPIQDIKLPDSVKTALKSRLTKLDEEALSTLEWAALIGAVFDFDLLKEASGATEDALLGILETANSQGLILELPNEPGKVAFQDERIRELLIEDVMQLKRRRYDQKIAEAMEKLYAASPESHSEAMASHFELAGDKERTIKYSIMAGDWNRSIHAYEEAVNNHKRALAKIEPNESKQRATLLEKLGESYSRAGRFSNSVEAYEEALKLLEKLQDHQACASVSTRLSHNVYRVKGPQEAIRFLRDAVKYVQENPESSEAAGLYGTLANFLSLLERYDEANEWSKRVLAAGEKSGNHAAASEGLMLMACYILDTGRIDEGLPILERSLDVAKKHNALYQTTNALLSLSDYVYPRDLSKARTYASQWLNLGKEENDVLSQASATLDLAFLDWLRGDWEAASKEFQEAFEAKNRLGFRFTVLNPEAWRARLHLSLGELEKAEEFCEAALARHDEQVYHIVATNLAVGKLRLEQGRLTDAKTHFEACVSAFKDHEFTTMPLLHVETLLHLTRIYAVEGQVEKARGMVNWAKRLAETLKSDAGLAMASQAEGTLLSATGDRKGAEEAYLECLALWEKAGWPYYHAKALVAYSKAILQTDLEESKKRLQRAAEIFKKLGAKRDLEKAQAKLSR
jgi:tetratricopeptide (TPR) repeat protein